MPDCTFILIGSSHGKLSKYSSTSTLTKGQHLKGYKDFGMAMKGRLTTITDRDWAHEYSHMPKTSGEKHSNFPNSN